VPSLESQILVLEIDLSVILVVDMVIFSEQAIQSETPVVVPWSHWGPQYTWCFLHDGDHSISVFGSKMAYALPLDHTPAPGELSKGKSDEEDNFYVHIWDFNRRITARAENANGRNCSDPVIRKPRRIAHWSFFEDNISYITSNRLYTATVCHTPFTANRFHRLFFDQDRLILSWVGTSVYEYIP